MRCRLVFIITFSILLPLFIACEKTVTFAPASAVSEVNSLPVAEAGQDKGVITGQSITLDGGNSQDADGDTLTYSWAIHSAPSGSAATLSQADTANPQLVTDVDGQYMLSLVVNDGVSGSSADLVSITASSGGNTPPSCRALPNISAVTGNAYTVNSVLVDDVDGDMLTYQWTLESIPDQSSTALSSESIRNPTLTPDTDGDYYLSLVVNDGSHDSQPCLVTISASSSPNAVPVAITGFEYGVYTDTDFAINGSGSYDPDGAALTYEWSVLNSPVGSTVTITHPDAANTELRVDSDGYYSVKFVVSDGISSSRPAIVLIKASSTGDIPQDVVTAFSSVCVAP